MEMQPTKDLELLMVLKLHNEEQGAESEWGETFKTDALIIKATRDTLHLIWLEYDFNLLAGLRCYPPLCFPNSQSEFACVLCFITLCKKVVAWDKSPRASAGRVRRRALAYKKAAADTDPFHLSLPSILPHYGQNVNSAVSKAGMNPLYPKASSYSWRTIKNPDYRNRWKWKNSWLNVTSSYWCLQNYQQSVFTYKAREHLDFMCHLISLASEWTIFIYIYNLK